MLLVEDQRGDGRCEGLRVKFAAGEMMLGPGKGGGRGTERGEGWREQRRRDSEASRCLMEADFDILGSK